MACLSRCLLDRRLGAVFAQVDEGDLRGKQGFIRVYGFLLAVDFYERFAGKLREPNTRYW